MALGLADFGRPGSYVARQISRWGKQYKASETEKIDSMDRLLDWLPAHLPANDETVLVHGDYRLDNMIFHPTEPRVLGIIDWEISTLGDPLAELSYLCMLWRTPKDWGGLKGHDLAALACRPSRRWWPTTASSSKRALPDPALWEFYMAYNLFRVSCIRQGVYARALDGTASNMRAAESGKLVRPAADLAWQIVDGMAGGRAMSKRKPVRVVETPAAAAERDPRPPVEAIRAAAFTQFAERGYPVVTVRDIMKACGLTQGALYNHFKSKDELLHDIIASTQGELERICQHAVAGAGDDPRAKLAAFVRVYVVRHCRLRVEALVANREISWLGAERVADIRRSRRAIRDIVVTILTEGVQRGAVRPAADRRPARSQGHRHGIARPVHPRLDVVRSWWPLGEEQMARLYADMALRAVGAKPQ